MLVAIISLITSLILEKIVNHSSADLVLVHLAYAHHLYVKSITIFQEKLSIILQLTWCYSTCYMLNTHLSYYNQHLVMSQLHPSTLPHMPHSNPHSYVNHPFPRNFLEQFGDLKIILLHAILLNPVLFCFFFFVVKACEVTTVWNFYLSLSFWHTIFANTTLELRVDNISIT